MNWLLIANLCLRAWYAFGSRESSKEKKMQVLWTLTFLTDGVMSYRKRPSTGWFHVGNPESIIFLANIIHAIVILLLWLMCPDDLVPLSPSIQGIFWIFQIIVFQKELFWKKKIFSEFPPMVAGCFPKPSVSIILHWCSSSANKF